MALRKTPVGRLYYRIGEVATIFNVNTSLIRFYEKEFEIIKPHRNKKGNRLFTQNDVDNFHKIFYYIKEKGYTLEGAKQKIKEKTPENTRDTEVLESLLKMKRFLLELRNQLDL
jgi:DNA-binding transcriptional MerR regulator